MKHRYGCHWGERPNTHQTFISLDPEQEKLVLEMSSISREVWNYAISWILYLADLGKRVKAGTALEEEKVYDKKKDQFVFRTNPTYINLTNHLPNLRNHSVFSYLKNMKSETLRETLRFAASSYKSYKELRKNKDPKAKRPQYKYDEDRFQSLCFLKPKQDGRILIIKEPIGTLKLRLPASTAQKLQGKKIIQIVLDRTENRLYLPGEYKIQIVTRQSENPPLAIKRAAGLAVGSSQVILTDSRGKTYCYTVRRPDHFTDRMGRTYRDKIADIDTRQKRLREDLKGKGMSMREIRLDVTYQELSLKKQELSNKMSSQRKDYYLKLANDILKRVDMVFVGKPIIRSQPGHLAGKDNGNPEKNWNTQNTGSLAGFIRLLAWKARCEGKAVLELPHHNLDTELPYKQGKKIQAKYYLKQGLQSERFETLLQRRREDFEKGYQTWLESNPEPDPRDVEFLNEQHLAHKGNLWNPKHIEKVLTILNKDGRTNIKQLSIVP